MRILLTVASAALLGACSMSQQSSDPMMPANTGNASMLSAWRGYKSQAIPTGWTESGGIITKTGNAEDLVSRQRYQNFDFSLDWKLDAGGNSGIFYRASEEYDHIYWSGPEYQLLDDAKAADGKNPLTSAASAYGLYAPPRGVVHAAGEWNSTRIIARGNHVEHWLNGQKVVEYDLMSPDWMAKLKASKFAVWPNYGRSPSGYIGIQGDHNGLLSLRNMNITPLP